MMDHQVKLLESKIALELWAAGMNTRQDKNGRLFVRTDIDDFLIKIERLPASEAKDVGL